MIKTVLTAFTMLFAFGINAQIYYATGAIAGNPGHLNNDEEAPVGSGLPNDWTVILQSSNSQPTWSSTETIPFPFVFDGQPETSFKASSSGVVTFNANTSMAAPGYTNFSLPNAAIPDKSIMVWGIQGTGQNDRIVTKVFGTAPNRQFWIFFTSFSVAGSNNGYTYWSIVLEETTNQIYVVDQRNNTNALSATIGVQVNSSIGYNATGTPNIGTLSGTDASSVDNFHYAFIPGPQPLVDMAAQNIVNDDVIALNTTPITLEARFGNYGINNLTSATINYSINGGNTVSAPLTGLNLNSLSSTALSHPTPWNPGLGTYTVEMWLTNPNGITDPNSSNDKVTKQIIISNSVGIEETEMLNALFTYPNPATDVTYLQFQTEKDKTVELTVVNEIGSIVYANSVFVGPSNQQVKINTSNLSSGVYFILVEADGASKTLKLIIE